MPNVHPRNKENAIKTAAFALELNKELDETTITAIQNLYNNSDDFKNDFKKMNPVNSLKVQMGEGVQQITSSALSGLSFLSTEENSAWVFQLQGKKISINCNDYTRWNEVSGFASKYFEKVIECLSDYTLIKVVVEYLDEFNINNLNDKNWKKELFSPSSKYLPQFIYDIDTPWHTHNGYITEDSHRRTVHLINVNFGKLHTGAGQVSMQTQHASQFYNMSKLEPKLLNMITEVMQRSHYDNKVLLTKVLSEEMLNTMNLKV